MSSNKLTVIPTTTVENTTGQIFDVNDLRDFSKTTGQRPASAISNFIQKAREAWEGNINTELAFGYVNVKDFAFDGLGQKVDIGRNQIKTLSDVGYTSLSHAQATYPTSRSLSEYIDGLAIQNAINYAIYDTSSTCRRVYIPSGLYHTTNTIEVGYGISDPGFLHYTSCYLLGDGGPTEPGAQTKGTYIRAHFSDKPACNIQGALNSKIEGIKFIGDNQQEAGLEPIAYGTWNGTAHFQFRDAYLGLKTQTYTFTVRNSGTMGTHVIYLDWTTNLGASGTVTIPVEVFYDYWLKVDEGWNLVNPDMQYSPQTLVAGDVFTVHAKAALFTYGEYQTEPSHYVKEVGLHPKADSRKRPYAGLTIDAHSFGKDPVESYPSVPYPINWVDSNGNAISQGWKALSSAFLVRLCSFSNFIVGACVHPNNSDGNGDFANFEYLTIGSCKYGLSVCQSQARLTNIRVGQIDNVWCGLTTEAHGDGQGRITAVYDVHFSGGMILSMYAMQWNGPLVLDGCYSESLAWFGSTANAGAGSGSIILRNCDLSVGAADGANFIPLVGFIGMGLVAENSRIGGPIFETATQEPTIIKNTWINSGAGFAYDGGLGISNFYANLNEEFYNVTRYAQIIGGKTLQIVAGDGGMIAGGNFSIDGLAASAVVTSESIGSNAFKYPNLFRTNAGKSGMLGDYIWCEKEGVTGYSVSMDGIKLTLTCNEKKYKVGDIFYVQETFRKFMIYSKSGSGTYTYECVLLNGFRHKPANEGYAFDYYLDSTCRRLDSAAGFFPPDCHTVWFNLGWVDHQPIHGTAVSNSNTITGVGYTLTVDNRMNAAANFPVGYYVYAYTYNTGAPGFPTSATKPLLITAVDSVNNTITFDGNVGLTGQVQIFSKWPFQPKHRTGSEPYLSI